MYVPVGVHMMSFPHFTHGFKGRECELCRLPSFHWILPTVILCLGKENYLDFFCIQYTKYQKLNAPVIFWLGTNKNQTELNTNQIRKTSTFLDWLQIQSRVQIRVCTVCLSTLTLSSQYNFWRCSLIKVHTGFNSRSVHTLSHVWTWLSKNGIVSSALEEVAIVFVYHSFLSFFRFCNTPSRGLHAGSLPYSHGTKFKKKKKGRW